MKYLKTNHNADQEPETDNPRFGAASIVPANATLSADSPKCGMFGSRKKLFAQICVLALTCGSALGQVFSFPNFTDLPQTPLGGWGVNPNAVDPHDLLLAPAVTGTIITNGSINPGNFSFTMTEVSSYSDIFNSESASASIEGTYLMYSGKASVNVRTASVVSSTHIIWIVTADKDYGIREQFNPVSLTPAANYRLTNDGYAMFTLQFGSKFISSWSRSGHLAVTFEAYNLTQSDQTYVQTMISASASFLAGSASAEATMQSAYSSLSSTAKTKVTIQADGMNTDSFFAGITDLSSLAQLQTGTINLISNLDNQIGNVAEYYTSDYSDWFPGFPFPGPVVASSALQTAQLAYEQAYASLLAISDFTNGGGTPPILDGPETSYLTNMSAQCNARIAEIGVWLQECKKDPTLKALPWPPIEVDLPRMYWFVDEVEPVYGLSGTTGIYLVCVVGGSDLGEVGFHWQSGVPTQYVSEADAVCPSQYDIQPLDTQDKLNQTRSDNGSLVRWFYYTDYNIGWNPTAFANMEITLLDESGKAIANGLDRHQQYVVSWQPLGATPWPGPLGGTLGDWGHTFYGAYEELLITKPINGATFTNGQPINLEASWAYGSTGAPVTFLLDGATLVTVSNGVTTGNTTLYDYVLSGAAPGTHQLGVHNPSEGGVLFTNISFTVAQPVPSAPVLAATAEVTNVSAGNTITLTAPVNVSGSATYTWYSNGVEIFDDTRISGSSTSVLNIAGATTNDAGNYRVVVSNAGGSVTSANMPINIGPATTTVNPGGQQLGINMFAGVSVAGIVGSNYTIYAGDKLGSVTTWTDLGTIKLTNGSPNLFVDPDSPNHPTRFYRVVGP
jgi:hypothetical protein